MSEIGHDLTGDTHSSGHDPIATTPANRGVAVGAKDSLRGCTGHLTVTVAIVAVIVPIVLFFAGRTTKSLSITTNATAAITPYAHGIKGPSIRLVHNDTDILKATWLACDITNTGNSPIRTDDIEQPLTLKIDSNDRLLDASISGTSPPGIPVEIRLDRQNEATITFGLLNPGDTIHAVLLIEGDPQTPIPRGRIAGVKKIVSVSAANPDSTNKPPFAFLPRWAQRSMLACAGTGAGLWVLGGLFVLRETLKQNSKPDTGKSKSDRFAAVLVAAVAMLFGAALPIVVIQAVILFW